MSLTDGPARQSPTPTRWSLRSLFFATGIAAFFAAALADPEGVGLVALLVALGSVICAGVVCFCPGQPFARGYVVAGVASLLLPFLSLAFGPAFLFVIMFPAFVTTRAVLWLAPNPDPEGFRELTLFVVAYSVWTILFGLLGGFVTRYLASRRGDEGRWLPHELTAAYRKGSEAESTPQGPRSEHRVALRNYDGLRSISVSRLFCRSVSCLFASTAGFGLVSARCSC